MKISAALLIGSSLLCLALSEVHAGEDPPLPALPQAYDLKALSQAPSQAASVLGSVKKMNDTARILPVVPAAGEGGKARIEWSGQVSTSVVYQSSKRVSSTELTRKHPPK